MDRLFIVYVVAAGRSITKYIRAPNQQKAKGTSSGVGGYGVGRYVYLLLCYLLMFIFLEIGTLTLDASASL